MLVVAKIVVAGWSKILKQLRKFSVLCLIICLLGCGDVATQTEEEQIISSLAWLYNANPEEDLLEALKQQDYRFVGFRANGFRAPEIESNCLDWDTQVKFIDTGHSFVNYEHKKLAAIAQVYAEDYNLMLHHYLTENQGYSCH